MTDAMMRHTAIVAFVLSVAGLSCGGSTPTAPSELNQNTEVGGTSFRVGYAQFTRDFMPIQSKPGPDGGGPLRGSIGLRLEHHGSSVRVTLAVSVCDQSGKRYPIVAVAHDYDAENDLSRVPTLWDGQIGPATPVRHIELQMTDGPYLAPGSKVFAVIDVSDSGGHKGSLTTPAVAIGRTD